MDDIEFITCDKQSAAFGRMLKRKFNMYDHMMALRNEATSKLMQDQVQHKAQERDPDASQDSVKRPKREVKDEIAQFVTIQVKTSDEQYHSVKVLTSALSRNKLDIELTDDNITLLTRMPHVQPTPKTKIGVKNVSWIAGRSCVRIRYYSESKGGWVFKSTPVDRSDNFDEYQARADAAAAELDKFFQDNHKPPAHSVKPGPKRAAPKKASKK